MFTWEALIMGPKDTPFEGGVFAAKLTFVSAHSYFLSFWHAIARAPVFWAIPMTVCRFQPTDYPLSPFKMKFEPPLFHPNSKSTSRFPLPPLVRPALSRVYRSKSNPVHNITPLRACAILVVVAFV